MKYTINYYWRLFATGLSFTVFGIGGLLIPIFIVVISTLIQCSEKKERFSKRSIHLAFKAFVALMRHTGVLSYQINDLDQIRSPGQLIVANHPTLIDIVFLISIIPQADCIVKSRLLNNPFTRWPIKAAGYIANDAADEVVDAAKRSLKRGNSLIIFPEGTRTTPGKPMTLQRGAANIAIRTANNLYPVIINCEPLFLTKQDKWHYVPKQKPHFSFRMGPEIEIHPYLDSPPASAARQLTDDLLDFFVNEVKHGRLRTEAQTTHY